MHAESLPKMQLEQVGAFKGVQDKIAIITGMHIWFVTIKARQADKLPWAMASSSNTC